MELVVGDSVKFGLKQGSTLGFIRAGFMFTNTHAQCSACVASVITGMVHLRKDYENIYEQK